MFDLSELSYTFLSIRELECLYKTGASSWKQTVFFSLWLRSDSQRTLCSQKFTFWTGCFTLKSHIYVILMGRKPTEDGFVLTTHVPESYFPEIYSPLTFENVLSYVNIYQWKHNSHICIVFRWGIGFISSQGIILKMGLFLCSVSHLQAAIKFKYIRLWIHETVLHYVVLYYTS